MNQQTDHVEAARLMMATCEEMFQYVVQVCTAIRADIGRGKLTVEQLTDVSYFIKKSSEYANECSKFTKDLEEHSSNLACYTWVMKPENVQQQKCPSIRGKYAIGTPDVTFKLTIPSSKKSPDKFIEFMAALGISKEAAISGLVTVHYPHVCELANQRLEEGLPNLPHVNPEDLYPTYKLKTREIVARKTSLEEK